MATATITSKGQVTIPKDVRDALGLRRGDRVEFSVETDGTIRLRRKTRSLLDLVGIVETTRRATLDEIEAAIRAGWSGR